jgi:hypothetical protein
MDGCMGKTITIMVCERDPIGRSTTFKEKSKHSYEIFMDGTLLRGILTKQPISYVYMIIFVVDINDRGRKISLQHLLMYLLSIFYFSLR